MDGQSDRPQDVEGEPEQGCGYRPKTDVGGRSHNGIVGGEGQNEDVEVYGRNLMLKTKERACWEDNGTWISEMVHGDGPRSKGKMPGVTQAPVATCLVTALTAGTYCRHLKNPSKNSKFPA